MLHLKQSLMSFMNILLCRLGIQHPNFHLSLSACEQVNLLVGGWAAGEWRGGGLCPLSCSILNSSCGLHPLGAACEVMIQQGPQRHQVYKIISSGPSL